MYSNEVMFAVRQALGADSPHDESYDVRIFEMAPSDVFNYYLQWNGIIGYTDTILRVVDDIYDTQISG
ncbi:hypothetical protein ABGV42_01520 [Paenibacillus pabuli]|uniref:hypothetical protein n=1 Tax=Paenibacillus pabuli TaxID=1472 RepID=UPI003242D23F